MRVRISRSSRFKRSKRCGQIFRHGIGLGYCSRDITVDIRGLIEAPTVQHHAGLTNPVEVGQLLRDIDYYTGRRQTVLALRLGTLTFARPKELRQAERAAFDLDAGEWRVSRTIMKMKVEHVIPLSRQAIQVVREALALLQGSRWLFPCLGDPPSGRCQKTPSTMHYAGWATPMTR